VECSSSLWYPDQHSWPHTRPRPALKIVPNGSIPTKPRSMAYIYGRIHCGPMLLWLAEAAGVSSAVIAKADRALRRSG
jgi:hypothetical protein